MVPFDEKAFHGAFGRKVSHVGYRAIERWFPLCEESCSPSIHRCEAVPVFGVWFFFHAHTSHSNDSPDIQGRSQGKQQTSEQDGGAGKFDLAMFPIFKVA